MANYSIEIQRNNVILHRFDWTADRTDPPCEAETMRSFAYDYPGIELRTKKIEMCWKTYKNKAFSRLAEK